MGNFRRRLAEFMYGRNGPDALYNFIWILSLIMLVISSVIRIFVSRLAGYILYGAAILLLMAAMFRVFSKNVERRRRENERYLRLKGRIRAFFVRRKNMKKYKDAYIYTKCPQCKNILRFRRVPGKHTAKCPCCKYSFDLEIK